MRLFHGLERAHGTYKLTGEKKVATGIKQEGKGTTLQQPVTAALWREHLEGRRRLGVVPIRDDGTVLFAAIDIDAYDLDIAALEKKVIDAKLPLVTTRSKSGGAHLYLFLTEPAQARDIRGTMGQWAILLGFPGAEIFPKQDCLAHEHDVGNWINMPYFDVEETPAYGILDGEALPLEDYLRLAEKRSTTLSAIEDMVNNLEEPEGLEDAPPCLQQLAAHGVPEGGRNDALFNFGVYARLRYGDDWEVWVDDYNNRFMSPMLGSKEVRDVIRSLRKKSYFYTCSRPVLATICSKSICRSRKYGVGSGDDIGVTIDGLTKIETDPPTYIVQVNGYRVKMELEDIFSQTRFIRRLLGVVDQMLAPVKPEKYRAMINSLLKEAERFEAPDDAGVDGMFVYHLQQFCTTKAPARVREEILLGKPWHDPDDQRTFFRSGDLTRYLEQQRFRGLRPHQIWSTLRDLGAEHASMNLNGKFTRLWSVQTFPTQTEDYEQPPEITQNF